MSEPIIDSNDEAEDESQRKPWYSWFARHKAPTIAAGGTCVAMVVAAVLVIPATTSTSESLVDEYLTRLQDGDVSAALEIVGKSKEGSFKSPPGGVYSDYTIFATDFLTDNAINTDWETESVRALDTEISHETDDRTVKVTRVLATATQEDQLVRGLFSVVDDSREDGPYLEKPFVYIDTGSFSENFLAIDHTTVDINEESRSLFALLPGAHEVFTGSELVESQDPHSAQLTMPSKPVTLPMPDLLLTDKGEDAANMAVKDRLDECAQSTATHPDDCPFGGDEYGWDEKDPKGIWSGGGLGDLTDLEWGIKTYPTFDFTVDGTTVTATVTDPGWATLAGKSKGKKFSLECEIGSVHGYLTADQRMSFDSEENRPSSRCTEA